MVCALTPGLVLFDRYSSRHPYMMYLGEGHWLCDGAPSWMPTFTALVQEYIEAVDRLDEKWLGKNLHWSFL